MATAVCRAANSRVCSLHSGLWYSAFIPAFEFALTSAALVSVKILFSFPYYISGSANFDCNVTNVTFSKLSQAD